MFRFAPEARLLLIGTVRAEETLPGHPLREFLAVLQRDGLVTEIALGPLTTTETASLAEHVRGSSLDPAMANSLYSETEGNPLFVVEMARAGTLEQHKMEQRVLDQPLPLLTQSASTLPPIVQTVLATRLAQLSPSSREVANVAAVIGREFPVGVLARASEASEDSVVRVLDELWQRRMVREQGTGIAQTYDFSHDKLRELVYVSLSPAHRRLLHLRVAEAFKAVYVEDQNSVSGQIAAHYERAGLPGQAIPYYQRAGFVAMDIYANAEAITAFERAAALLLEAGPSENAQQEKQWETATQVYESLGDIFVVTGQLQEARQAYQQAIASLPSRGSRLLPTDNTTPTASLRPSQSDGKSIWHARLQRKMASTWNRASSNPHDTFHVQARQAFQEAECILMDESDQSNPAWRHEWIELQIAQIWPLRGSADDMTATIEKARPIVEQYGTAEQREFLSYAIATRDLIRNRYVTSISEQKMSSWSATITAIEQAGNKSKLGLYLLGFGSALLWSGHLDEAEEYFGRALRVGEQIGSTMLQIRGLTFLSFIYRRRGQVQQVRSILTRAQAVGAAQNNRILTGHHAWVTWRDCNLVDAETYGQTSLEQRQAEPDVNAFHWVAAWPLLGVALVQEKIAEVMNYVRMLLDPTQQPPPEPLSALLESALRAWDAGSPEEARALLQQAVPLAENLGYL